MAELIAAGQTDDEIATHFGTSQRTVVGRVVVIMNKLSAAKRADIGPWVVQHRPT